MAGTLELRRIVGELCTVRRGRRYVRKELLEGSLGYPETIVGTEVIHEFVESLLSVSEGALEVGIVAAPANIPVAHRG